MVNENLAKGLEKLIKSKNGDFASGDEIKKKMLSKVNEMMKEEQDKEFDAESEGAKRQKLQERMENAIETMLKETEISYILNILKEKKEKVMENGEEMPDQMSLSKKR